MTCRADDDQQAAAFIGMILNVNQARDPAFSSTVDFLIGGEKVATLSRSEALLRDSWAGCPGAGSYAARTCPVSVVDIIGSQGPADLEVSAQIPQQLFCIDVRTPRAWREGPLTVIRAPAKERSCINDFILVLRLDDTGSIRAVDVEIAEP